MASLVPWISNSELRLVLELSINSGSISSHSLAPMLRIPTSVDIRRFVGRWELPSLGISFWLYLLPHLSLCTTTMPLPAF